MKKQTTIKIREEMLQYVDTIAKKYGKSRSAIIDGLISITETYPDNWLEMELKVHIPKDGRRKS